MPAEPSTPRAGGFLLLDKPAGVSSNHSLYPIKRKYRGAKVGFAGTLDPAASGLLLIGIGAATRLLEYVEGMPKAYEFDLVLGVETDTYDLEGEVLARRPEALPTEAQLVAALAPFRGEQLQMPPVYSAIKLQGKRACDRVRRGEQVELTPRRIVVHALELLGYQDDRARLRVFCSKGTYVRSIAHDLGRNLGCGGAADRIRRTAIGPFRVDEACAPEDDTGLERLLPPETALAALSRAYTDALGATVLQHGNSLPAERYRLDSGAGNDSSLMTDTGVSDAIAVFGPDGALLAIAHLNPDRQLCPRKVLSQPASPAISQP